MKSFPLLAVFASVAAITFSGCETPSDTALLGAASGAAIGGLLHGRADQALVGAAIGGGAGYLAGKVSQDQRRQAYSQGYYQGRAVGDDNSLPYARPSNTRDMVISPYKPYNLIDVRGIPSGARVIDPSCDRSFINP